MLSEKAKGKQRAVDVSSSDHGDGGIVESRARDLVVRFTEGIPDLTVSLRQSQSVKDLKKSIREARPQLQRRRLRIIHAGRLLVDDTKLYEWLASLEQRRRQAAADGHSEEGKGKGVVESGTSWVHCSVGPAFEPEEDEAEEKTQTAQLQPLRGFDRLAAAGFSEEDIANFRRTFHSQSSSNYLDDSDFSTEEEYAEHARALEEQWIDSLDNPLSASTSHSSYSEHASVLQGILLGFFFPLLPLFFMREPKPAVFWETGEWEGSGSVIFSKRMQMGLVVGFLVNMLFGMWRFLLDAP